MLGWEGEGDSEDADDAIAFRGIVRF